MFIWTLLALVVGTFAFSKMDTSQEVLLLFATTVIYISIGVCVVGKEYLKQQKVRKSITFLKSKNKITVVEVSSGKYYELKEEQDEGVYYLFQLDNNKVFSFGGQDFYPNKRFPSDKFEIIEGRGLYNEILLLETYCYGKKIHPTRIITGQEKWNMLNSPNYPDPGLLTVAEGRIEDYLQTTASRS